MVDVQYRKYIINEILITVLCLLDVDAWHLVWKPKKFEVETIEPSGITGEVKWLYGRKERLKELQVTNFDF